MKYELPSTELIVIEENNYLKFGEYLNDMQCDDTANKLSLDDLEYVKKLQQENKILKENAENNDKVVDKVNWKNMLLKKENKELKKQLEEYKNPIKYFKYANKNVTEENKQLKDNWNKLKECLKDVMNSCDDDDKDFVETILDKMQELEQGSD